MATRILSARNALTGLLFVCLTGLAAEQAEAQGYHWNKGGPRADGGWTQPHFKSNPDGNPWNNLGSWRR